MLSVEEINEIQNEIKQYPYPKVACIDALKIVQQHRAWVSDESVSDIAELLGMSAEEVDGIATFYSRIYRQPVGRNIILICDSVSCMIMGYESLYEYLSKKLKIRFGETTSDGRFTIMVNNDHFNRLTIEKLDEILDRYK
jgi:NADH-quinone oxidoreductase subunit E